MMLVISQKKHYTPTKMDHKNCDPYTFANTSFG